MHTKCLGGDEKVFVQSKPLGTLAQQVAKRSTLTGSILDVSSGYGLKDPEQRVHLRESENQKEHRRVDTSDLRPSSSYRVLESVPQVGQR